MPKPHVLQALNHVDRPVASATAPTMDTRTLGAIIPQGQQAWFIKLTGPEAAVAQQTANFHALVQSMEFDEDGKAPRWKLPDGWRQEAASGLRYATLTIASGSGEAHDEPLEVSVSTLPWEVTSDTEGLLANINRWRGQLQLPSLTAGQLPGETIQLTLKQATATLVNLVGQAAPGGMRPPFAGPMSGPAVGPLGPELPNGSSPTVGPGVGPVATATAPTIKAQAPADWQSVPVSGLRKAAWKITADGQQAEVTIIDLEPQAGELLPNINRWRQQVQLSEVTAEELEKQLENVTLGGGASGRLVLLVGPESASPRQAILGVVSQTGGKAWFIKMMGDAPLVQAQQENFRRFLGSVQLQSTKEPADGQ